MFLAAGGLLLAAPGGKLTDLAGLARSMPWTVTAFALAAVSLMGLPPSGGFVAKFLLLSAAIEQGLILHTAVLLVGGLLAAIYLFRPLTFAFASGDAVHPTAIPASIGAAPMLLALLAIALGFGGNAVVELSTLSPIALLEPLSEPESTP